MREKYKVVDYIAKIQKTIKPDTKLPNNALSRVSKDRWYAVARDVAMDQCYDMSFVCLCFIKWLEAVLNIF